MKKVLVILALLAVTGIASAELLTNGDFSGGGGFGWAEGWDAVWEGGVWADTGQNALKAWGTGGLWSNGGASQTVAATAGVEYFMSADILNPSAEPLATGGSLAVIKVEFLDAAAAVINGPYGTELDGIYNGAAAYDVWIPLSGSIVAPAGTVNAKWSVMVQDSGGGASVAWFDNVSVVPEPATMALLGLGGLLLRRRK